MYLRPFHGLENPVYQPSTAWKATSSGQMRCEDRWTVLMKRTGDTPTDQPGDEQDGLHHRFRAIARCGEYLCSTSFSVFLLLSWAVHQDGSDNANHPSDTIDHSPGQLSGSVQRLKGRHEPKTATQTVLINKRIPILIFFSLF